MEWLRWHHGCVTDPKFRLIAMVSGQNVASVLAVWAAILERASQADDRGSIDGFDCESFDAHFGLIEGACQAIVDALRAKGMIEGIRVAKWDERQPAREREDVSTSRVRAFRERKRANETRETQCNASETHETPRVEEIREELNTGGGIARARVADSVPESANPDSDVLPKSLERPEGPKRTDCPSKGTPEWPAFLSCWNIYPVQQGQEDAWREWVRLKESGTLAQAWEIRDAIMTLAAEDSRWQRGKVPKMAKWLAGKGWDDKPYKEPDAILTRDGPPVARTQAQQQAQDRDAMAKMVLAHREGQQNADARQNSNAGRNFGASIAALPAGRV